MAFFTPYPTMAEMAAKCQVNNSGEIDSGKVSDMGQRV
jgi:hypothetical protein